MLVFILLCLVLFVVFALFRVVFSVGLFCVVMICSVGFVCDVYVLVRLVLCLVCCLRCCLFVFCLVCVGCVLVSF